eukprot:3145702-Prymnesium_polylepis.1
MTPPIIYRFAAVKSVCLGAFDRLIFAGHHQPRPAASAARALIHLRDHCGARARPTSGGARSRRRRRQR